MKTQHTPGPWMPPDSSRDLTIWATKNGKTELIASTNTNQWCKEDEANANARLISAAPELLEVAITLRDMLSGLYHGIAWFSKEEEEKIHAAIAKATEKEVQP